MRPGSTATGPPVRRVLWTSIVWMHPTTASNVAKFLRVGLTRASPRPTEVTLVSNWSRVMRRTVHAILRFECGEWPPGSGPSPVAHAFRQYLVRHQYNHTVAVTAVAAVNQFVQYLQCLGKGPEAARPADVNAFVQQKREQYEDRHAIHHRVNAAGAPSTPVQSIECCDLLTKNGHVRNRRAMRPNACGAIRFKRSPTRSQMFAGYRGQHGRPGARWRITSCVGSMQTGWLHPVTSVWRRSTSTLNPAAIAPTIHACCGMLRAPQFSPLPFSGRWHGQRCVARNIRAPPLPRLSRFHGRSPMSRFAGHSDARVKIGLLLDAGTMRCC